MQDDFNSWQEDVNNQVANNTKPQDTYGTPMKWHKFLIYFSLWAGAVMNVLSAVQMFTGAHYGSQTDAAFVYMVYDGLKAVDIIMAVLSLGMAALLIVARFALAGYKENGPKLLMVAYIATAAINLLYPVAASVVTGVAISELLNIGSIIGNVAMIFINKAYYDKRSHLFIY